MLVGEWLVDEWPEVFGRLQFRGVGWLLNGPDAVRDGQVFRRVPASIVELKDDDAVASGAGVACEGFEQLSEAKKGLSMPFDRNQTVSPLAGATKAVT